MLIPTNKYIAITVDPFGFNFAKLKPANKEQLNANKTDPKTSFAELKKFLYILQQSKHLENFVT